MKTTKKTLFSVILILVANLTIAQIPSGYYDGTDGLTGSSLKTALYNIITSHTTISYSGLWTAYSTTDRDNYYENDGTILDMYSENPSGSDPYEFTYGNDQCGTYSSEGDCYNREHSFPKSWFNDASPMYSDLFHIYPTDGKVNGMRSNYPYGEVSSPTYTSDNGSKLGPCSYSGYTGTVFEPIDEFKGDLARTYFYMATCYEDRISGWSSAVLDGSSYPCYTTWFLNMLLEWDAQDPVSQREIDRNNAVYSVQGNRNPYIDHPEFSCLVFGSNCTSDPYVWGNPSSLSGLSYVVNYGPSSASSFSVAGSNLDGSNVTVAAPSNYEISKDNNTYSSSITLTSFDGTSTTVYVRLKELLPVGSYNGQITISGGGAASNATVTLNGQVTEASLFCDDFESDFSNWTVTNGTDAEVLIDNTFGGANSTSYAALFDASNGVESADYTSYIEKTFSNVQNLSVNFWYYFEDYRGGEITVYVNDVEQYAIYTVGDGDLAISESTDDTWAELQLDLSSVTSSLGTYTIKIEGVSKTSASTSSWKDRVVIDELCVYGSENTTSPVLTSNKSSISGFAYIYGNGPSASQTFTVSGANLDGSDVVLTAPTNYEISNDNISFSNSITLTAFDGSVTTIYTRLKESLVIGTYNNETLTISGGSAPTITVSLSGEVTNGLMYTSVTELSSFSYIYDNGPSASQTFKLSGIGLDGSDVTITAPADYELSTDDNSYSSTITLSAYDGTEQTIYVRLKVSLDAGSYNDEIITISGGDVSDVTVTLSGEVIAPELTAVESTLSDFSYLFGFGPSTAQSFVLSGTNLNGTNAVITAPTNYEISTDGVDFYATITIVSYDGSETTLYARLKEGLAIGNYNSEKINISGCGSAVIYVTLNGTVLSDVVTSTCEDFDDQSGTSYLSSFTTEDMGDWTSYQAGNFDLGTPRSDPSCIAINDNTTGAQITTPSFNTVGSVDFWYYQRSGDASDEFQLQISEDGGDFVTLVTQSFNVGTTYTEFNYDINSSSTDVKIRILNDNQEGHLIVDDFCVTSYSSVVTEIVANPTSLSGFSYIETEGASTSQSFEITGTNLNGTDVTVSAPSSYEVSLDNVTFNTSVTLPSYDGSSTLIYVHLKAGLESGNYNEDITINGGGGYDVYVNLAGEVLARTLTTSINSVSELDYVVGNGPSASQSFTVSGEYLDGSDITITAPTNFEISNDDITFGSLVTLSSFDGSETTIYVQLKAGLGIGLYNSETLTVSGGGADDVTVILSGEVEGKYLLSSVSNLYGFTYIETNGPSASQTFNVSGKNLDGSDVELTAPADYEVSTDNQSFSSTVTLSSFNGTSTAVYARLKAGLDPGNYDSEELIISGGNATSINVILNGTVTELPPVLETSTNTISDFNYTEGEGPSVSQSFELSGTNLDGTDVTLTAPTNYEVSDDNTIFENSLTLSAYDGTTATIYIRLKADLNANTYNSEILTINGGGAENVYITLNGEVFSATLLPESDLSYITVFPNPVTKESVTITKKSQNDATVFIYDLNGRIVLQDVFSGKTGTFNVESLESGVYIIKIVTDLGTQNQKLIVE